MVKITKEELKKFNGAEGRPVHFAYQGKVYDVTKSPLWRKGVHMKKHPSGEDLTGKMVGAPHGEEVLAKFNVAGELDLAPPPPPQPSAPPTLTERLEELFVRFHPHPPTVHFPIALMVTTVILNLFYLVTGEPSFEKAAYYVLGLGLLFSPVSILTGLVSWKLTYKATMTHIFARKIQFSALLFPVALICFLWRTIDPDVLTGFTAPLSWVYLFLVLSLAPIAIILGYYGGKIVFPTAF